MLDTSSQYAPSEYTVNSSYNVGARNTILQDVVSNEQMESALTQGTESLHEQARGTMV